MRVRWRDHRPEVPAEVADLRPRRGRSGEVAGAVMRTAVLFLLVAAAGAGCSAFTIKTEDHVRLESLGVSRVSTETPPVLEGGPVVPMPLGGGCGGPTVAL